MIKWKKYGDKEQSVKCLDQCLNLHITATREIPAGFEFYTKLNADFLMELAKEYLQHVGEKPLPKSEPIPKYLAKAIKLLENVIR